MGTIISNRIVVAIIFFAFAFVVLWWALSKTTKEALARKYGISRPTLQKWMRYFQNEINLEEWKKRRSLTEFEATRIQSLFGFDRDVVLSKAQIAERAESNNKTVSENVLLNLDKIGITRDAWKSCNYFPPVISSRILEVLG